MIDHKTCGHVNHVTFDAGRHQEIHSAVWRLIRDWELRANHLEAMGEWTAANVLRERSSELSAALHPFEVEQ